MRAFRVVTYSLCHNKKISFEDIPIKNCLYERLVSSFVSEKRGKNLSESVSRFY